LAPAPPGAWPGLDGDQSSEAPEASAWMDPAGFPPDWFGPMEGELPGSDSLAAFLPGFLGPQEQEVPQGAGGTGTPELPQPPDEVPYSPDSLVSIREMRLSVSEAMDTVRSYIDASDDSRKGNEAALAKVGELQESHTGQKDAIGLQKTEITGQQGKLDQAGEAQKNMSKEGEKASGESEKAKTEGDTVKSKGSTVTVEAKPEEPESKSWLERAWDATAGAAWDALVAPAVRAVKRKVEGVMESISGFLMGVINQALGLDEIEAELQQGGSDIQKRDESLGTTETGLGEVEGETALAMEQNAATSQQAKDNIGEAGAVRGEAEGLLGNLVAHDTALAADEAAGEVYVADFSLRYGEVFAPSKEAESTAGEEDAWA
jgi:hypothetical protein